ncbi:FkbM family methyltransferase [Natrarchaeobaculum aegyptiacum]|uniref:Methyltransferase FkbM domain-containing protein n=1 Tax=Natrarchaeobaculum aegyptiacum TaxID=745377 RepID=A0A2Z2HS57_9EURY|nr:FkbM family methyltransferase [Natrarchaeobaculum aegyptiacum]ARS89970.1 hypothetical protein B1756_09665 [Natrarchaeobaculum aegyptiacum]
MIRRIQSAWSDASAAKYFFRRKLPEVAILTRRFRFVAAAIAFCHLLTGRKYYDTYFERVRRKGSDRRCVDVGEHQMVVDVSDDGLSRDLYLFGTREHNTTRIYERELERVERERNEPMVVLDVGSNAGYFALSALGATSEETDLIAFEPDGRTLPLLGENVERNGYADRVTVEELAIGPEPGAATIELASHSNLNQIRTDEIGAHTKAVQSTRQVTMESIDSYLRTSEIDPAAVGAVRMDVEGYEIEIIDGMKRLLESDHPLLLFLEMHPHMLRHEQTKAFLETLENAGFVVESVSIEGQISYLGFEERRELSFEDLVEIEHGYRVFFRR